MFSREQNYILKIFAKKQFLLIILRIAFNFKILRRTPKLLVRIFLRIQHIDRFIVLKYLSLF